MKSAAESRNVILHSILYGVTVCFRLPKWQHWRKITVCFDDLYGCNLSAIKRIDCLIDTIAAILNFNVNMPSSWILCMFWMLHTL